ncbi:hypothetical protein [Meiothermus granaticius]|uniref:Uncharacterized protein n=1 Tax=Meiothermus granaticius NBRC 107808 TaxID=1227551 RepID=A0A399FCM5_9DEIN|nr:hypothetical protein [Meiothermus granaticius]RIH94008.1 hypothetical protein Mgrana_00094 [Meiothermus granaticius NBRC 107808]GEM88163.1 hypothetical protein MGR01S_27880 [Meiothermus granaticius NBRC 107808]
MQTEFEKMTPTARAHIIQTLRQIGAESLAEQAAALNTAANQLERDNADLLAGDINREEAI